MTPTSPVTLTAVEPRTEALRRAIETNFGAARSAVNDGIDAGKVLDDLQDALLSAVRVHGALDEAASRAVTETPEGLAVDRLRVAVETIGRVDVEDTESGWRLYAEDIAHEYDRAGTPLTTAERPSEGELRSSGQRRRWERHRAELAHKEEHGG